jgi:hypothetical protein
MKATILAAALLAGGVWAAAPAGAQQAGTQEALTPKGGTEQGMTGQGAAAGAAAQGGVQGDCPEGQVRSAGGACAPGQPAATDVPASPHQQELLRGQQGNETNTPQQ